MIDHSRKELPPPELRPIGEIVLAILRGVEKKMGKKE